MKHKLFYLYKKTSIIDKINEDNAEFKAYVGQVPEWLKNCTNPNITDFYKNKSIEKLENTFRNLTKNK